MFKYVFILMILTFNAMADGTEKLSTFDEKLRQDVKKYEEASKACDITFLEKIEIAKTHQ